MAKKTKLDLGLIATFVAAVLGVIAVISLFLPAIAIKDADTTYSGLQVVFGYTKKTELFGSTVSTEILKFSFMNLLTFILAIVGVVFTVLGYLGKGSKFATLIATAAYLVAGIFFLLTISFTIPAVDENLVEKTKEFYSLGAGAIIGAVCSFLSAIASGYKLIVK